MDVLQYFNCCTHLCLSLSSPQKGMWDPRMKPYLFGTAADVHIIDLEQTLPMLRRALDVARYRTHENIYIYIFWCILTSLPLFDSALSRGIAAENGIILFVDTRLEVNPFIHSFLLSFFFFTPSPLSP